MQGVESAEKGIGEHGLLMRTQYMLCPHLPPPISPRLQIWGCTFCTGRFENHGSREFNPQSRLGLLRPDASAIHLAGPCAVVLTISQKWPGSCHLTASSAGPWGLRATGRSHLVLSLGVSGRCTAALGAEGLCSGIPAGGYSSSLETSPSLRVLFGF